MENQKTEWKRQWRDEFLKGLCGLANAQGGTLEVGRDDSGAVVGVDNAKELLEELPNTIRHALGIVPSVELLTENGKRYIAVSVDASGTPVSFRGRHYIRSGSTTQELSGRELDNFILRRLGKTWDSMLIPNVKVSDLDSSSFRIFREKALVSERLQKADLEMSDAELLDSLLLTENGELTRAAVLLFHHNPEKYVFGAFVKVGYFESGADLIYQDEFHGSLITVADQIVDTIYRKYFKGIISYEGITRVTDYPVPRPALREAIFNAIVHRDYTTGIPIQIKVFPDCVIVYNDGRLPETWTVDNLLKKHRSRPYNPKIAHVFYRAGFIETWGRGIERITGACKGAGKREPLFEVSPGEVSVTFYTDVGVGVNVGDGIGDSIGDGIGDSIGENEMRSKILRFMRSNPTISAKAIAAEIGIAPRNVEAHIRTMKKAGLVERIGTPKTGHWVVKSPQ
ncbi:MAG: putative DNA binding domain-containing protein [Clostridiales Family XIII bacterium]|nr:putative DNA binding domain-containing protein [Clostridiales Family XIII bacterium]